MKDYIKTYQQGGPVEKEELQDNNQLFSMDTHRANLPIAKRSSIPQPKMPLKGQGQVIVRNFLTGAAVGASDRANNVPGTPGPLNGQGGNASVESYQKPSVRERIKGAMNNLDRGGKSEVAKIVTNPVNSAMDLLRPDKYFTGASNDDDIVNGVARMGGDALSAIPAFKVVGSLPGVFREGVVLADSQLSGVGRRLEDVATRGRAAGLTEKQVAANQLDKVGITSNQRRGYMPGVSELLQKRITPFGYPTSLPDTWDRLTQGNSLNQTEKEIASGALDNKDGLFSAERSRNDAWRMYLGMPQKNNTFRMAEDFDSGFGAKPGEDRYGLNYDHNKSFMQGAISRRPLNYVDSEYDPDGKLIPRGSFGMDRGVTANDFNVMGNYGVKEHPQGLEYWDRWDLDPEIDRPFSKAKLMPMDSNNPWEDYVAKPKITIPVSKYLGKPFVSNGIISDQRISDYYDVAQRAKNYGSMNDLVKQFMQANPPGQPIVLPQKP